ncbi:MAG TPA: hypothetical protein VGN82_17470 [Bosea sp. (in: a-proteobacteria)]|jgi:hypothetical protein|uniref:hypothetical protein n=1 Tax=Bosea sp. (in: a-proteobacteria) TaxID=1871050 RepID=UPI002E153992|nr:hypothetical protein [Bosea sp. (in: a-proteobacteria)]
MIRGILPRLRSIAYVVWRFVLATQIARLTVMAVKLWPRVKLPSLLLALLALACLLLAGLSARTVFTTLAPTSPSGIGAGIAAGVTALAVLELCAFTTIAGIEAVLQLAHDFGRHRIGVLLAIATLLAAAAAISSLPIATDLTNEGWFALGVAALLLAMTGWFQRTYRRPARGGFRDFHVDVVDARHFLARSADGA